MMQGEGSLAHPMAFGLCLVVSLVVLWLWKQFMGQ
jgi:hypothetical protein